VTEDPSTASRDNQRAPIERHTGLATALAAIDAGRLEQVHRNALRFIDRCAYAEGFSGLAVDADEGDRMARVTSAQFAALQDILDHEEPEDTS
jgi:hypothetical protein